MITDPDQIEALLVSTEDLIRADGVDVTLYRSVWVQTASGGVVRSGDPQPQFIIHLFFGAVTLDPPRVIRDEGEMVVLRHVLIGMPTDDIQQKDYFFVGTRRFEVLDVDPERTWQTKAWCVEKT